MKVFIILILFKISLSFLNKTPYFLGTYILRKTNDKNLELKLAYLNLIDDNYIKFKTIDLKGVIATKISRTGNLTFIKKNVRSNFNSFNIKLNNIDFNNDFDSFVQFNNVNKYSYSYFGIEFPQIKYKQITNYYIKKKIRIRQTGFTIYVTDYNTNNYYIFDLIQDTKNNKLPYVEVAFTTLLLTNIFNYIINIMLINIIKIL